MPHNCKTTVIVLCLTCMVLFNWFFSSTQYQPKFDVSTDERKSFKRYTLDFVPRPPSRFADCDDLFTGTPVDHFNMSSRYWLLYDEFQAAVDKHRLQEGVSGTKITQMMALHYIAARPSVRHICEIGFNMGHSSFNFLTSNSKAIVHSFDLGRYAYSKVMSQFMTKHFPNRFFMHFGDSRKTVPQFINANPTFLCDIILVDGGHTYTIATADLENCVSISNTSNHDNAIIFDDYPALWQLNANIGRAWENLLRRHSVVELMRCMYSNRKTRPPSSAMGVYVQGFAIGTTIEKWIPYYIRRSMTVVWINVNVN